MLVPLGRPFFVALLAVLVPLSPSASELTLSLPEGLPGGDDVAGWEQFEGRAEIGGQDIAYILYVDPRYPALYRLTRYQITVVTRTAGGPDPRSAEDEKLIWNARPGIREPLRCYSLQTSPKPRKWQTVSSDSDDYRSAMRTAMSLYNHHNHQSRLQSVIP
jgi:hypothetical protein